MLARKGFTLIELLTTISILAVLAVILTGASSKIFSSGKTAKSISNLRQIATAMNAYAGENDDNLPRGYFYQPGQSEVTYVNELLPYLGEQPSPLNPQRNIFISPSSALRVPAKPANALVPLTYSVHSVLCPDTSNGKAPMKRSMIARPTQVIMIGDSAQNPSSKNSLSTLTAFSSASTRPLDELFPVGADSDTSAGLGALRYRSDGKAAVAMVDGHVELIKKGTLTYANVIVDR
jgi:prepilin-type N-terminal cleavage/methylation domain-containing protein/prepilin-type processing-associated H-X9-DG protein